MKAACITKGNEETLGSDGNVWYLDCTGVCTTVNLIQWFNLCADYYM